MANQNQILNNLKTIHTLQSSGSILSFLREIRATKVQTESLQAKLASKLKEKQTEAKVLEQKAEIKPKVEKVEVKPEKEEVKIAVQNVKAEEKKSSFEQKNKLL